MSADQEVEEIHELADAMAHALAAEYLGMKLVYLEAGSGASRPVPPDLIRKVSDYISLPLVVGGGIGCPEQASEARAAGADIVVIGDALERDDSPALVREFARAIHGDRVTAS